MSIIPTSILHESTINTSIGLLRAIQQNFSQSQIKFKIREMTMSTKIIAMIRKQPLAFSEGSKNFPPLVICEKLPLITLPQFGHNGA